MACNGGWLLGLSSHVVASFPIIEFVVGDREDGLVPGCLTLDKWPVSLVVLD